MNRLAACAPGRFGSLAWLRPAVVGALVVAWPLLGLMFLLRRFQGKLQPLPELSLIFAGVLLAAIALGVRSTLPGRWRLVPAVTLALFALALSLPGTHPAALVCFWLILIGEEIAAGWQLSYRPARRATIEPATAEGELEAEEEAGTLLPFGTSQQITRTRDETGQETLSCLLRVSFATGEQTQTLHVAFCPALDGSLHATSQHLEGAPCEIKLSQVEAFGARLDVKRRGALQLSDEAIIQLQVTARAAS